MQPSELDQFFEQSHLPVIAIDAERHILFCNPAASEAFDLPDMTLAGEPLDSTIQHPDLLALFDEASAGQLDISTPNGLVYRGQITHIRGLGSIAMLLDVTRQRDLENLKANFLANVSRDLRSPLTAILGYVELLDRVGPMNEQQRDFIGRIIFSAHSITALLTKALDLEKIEVETDGGREAVSMGHILEYSLEGMRKRIDQKSLQFEVFVDDQLRPVSGNPVRLRQLIGNLLDNAIRFTPTNGFVRVDLYLESDFVVLVVADTGVGISPEEQPYIFERFYRGSNSSDGSGLGLSIVKSIVEQHGGRIWVESQVNKGSTFTVMLPT